MFILILYYLLQNQIFSPGSLDTMEQVNTRHNLTSGKSLTNLEWTTCSARAMKLPSLTALIKPRTIVVEVKDWGSSVQQVNATNCPGSDILSILIMIIIEPDSNFHGGYIDVFLMHSQPGLANQIYNHTTKLKPPPPAQVPPQPHYHTTRAPHPHLCL